MNTILIRIRELITHLGITDTSFAQTIDIGQTTLSNMFQRESDPKSEVLQKIVSTYHVNSEWLLMGEGEMFTSPKDSLPCQTKIPLLRQKVSCGPGQNWEAEQNIEGYIEPLHPVPSLSTKNIFAFKASGVSMIGLGIQDGDIVFFDGSSDQRMRDGIYVFGFAGEAYCKLLRFEPLENKVMVYSVQKQDLREAELIRTIDADSDDFRVFGRVLAWLHENTLFRGI